MYQQTLQTNLPIYNMRAFRYEVITPPAVLPFSLATLKKHLKIDDPAFPDDDYLTDIIKAVGLFCEKYTRRTLINTGYRTFRDIFFCDSFLLRRSLLQAVDSFQYIEEENSTFVNVPADTYYNTVENDYSSIYLLPGKSWPEDKLPIKQSIRIDFTAGYGPSEDDIPEDLLVAMLNHAADMYQNRGDCNTGSCQDCLSKHTEQIYNLYRILDVCPKNVN